MANKYNWILSHEHLNINLSKEKNIEDTNFNDETQVLKEIKSLKEKGLIAIIDVSTEDMNYSKKFISKVETEAGIKVYKGLGLYKEPFIFMDGKINKNISVKEIESFLLKNIEEKNLYGEIGTSLNKATEIEEKLFQAIINIKNKYDMPIYTHTTLGTHSKWQVDFFIKNKINPKNVVIGHMDLSKKENEIFYVLEKGFNVGIDTIGKTNYKSDEDRLSLIKKIVDKGFLEQIVLSMDITRKSSLKNKGGIGYEYIIDEFIPNLEKQIGYENTKIIIEDNPKNIFNL